MAKTKHFTYKIILLLPIFLLILGGVYFLTNKVVQPKSISINEITTDFCTKDAYTCPDGSNVGRTGPDCDFVCPGSVAINGSPNPAKLTIGQDYKLSLSVVPSTNPLTAVQLDLIYDPTKIEIFGLDHSDYLPLYLVNPKFNPGSFETTLAIQPDSGGVTEAGIIGPLLIKPLELGEHLIQFGSDTLVATLNNEGNAYQPGRSINLTVFNQGDINYDKIVNLFDYSYFVLDFGRTDPSPADFNGNGKVDLFDYTIFVTNYGKTSP